MPDPSSKPDRFKPAMPAIPGVPAPAPENTGDADRKEGATAPPLGANRRVQIGAGASLIFLVFLALLLPRFLRQEPPLAPIVLDNAGADPGAASSGSQTPAVGNLPLAPGPIASPQELSKPWSVVKFQMRLPTGETAPAQVIRLPGGEGASAYWGFLSVAPYGSCEMQLVQDLEQIGRDYTYRARHPMVVDSCTQTIYDPLSYGSARGAVARGQVVSGPGLRPPLAVEIVIEKGNIVATRSE